MAATRPLLEAPTASEFNLQQRFDIHQQKLEDLLQRLEVLQQRYPKNSTTPKIKRSHSIPSPTPSEHLEDETDDEGQLVSLPSSPTKRARAQGSAWATMMALAESLELAIMSWVNQKWMPHSNCEPLPAEVVLVSEPPFEFSSGLAIPTDPRVATLCKDYWPVNVGTQCSGPAFIYSLIANSILHSSVIFFSILVFALSTCESQSGAASYPLWVLIPVCLVAFAVQYLECQALRYYTLTRVLLLQQLTLPVIGSVSYITWLCYNSMMTFVGVLSMHTSAFAVAQTLKGYNVCNSTELLNHWTGMRMKQLPFLPSSMWYSLNPATILLIIWIMGFYPVWRAWTQSVRCPWLKSGACRFVKKWDPKKFPHDIENSLCEEPDVINYMPQVVFKDDGKKKPRKLEVRWRSLAYKLKLEIWFTNFGIALASNAKVCSWAAVSSFLFPSELAKLEAAEKTLDAKEGDIEEGLGKCVNEVYYLKGKVLVSIMSFVFLRGVLVVQLKLSVFDLQLSLAGNESLSAAQVQVLFSMILSIGLICLDLKTTVPIVLKSFKVFGKVAAGVEKKRLAYKEKEADSPHRLRNDPNKEESEMRRLFERHDAAGRTGVKIIIWLVFCALLLVSAFVIVVFDLLKIQA